MVIDTLRRLALAALVAFPLAGCGVQRFFKSTGGKLSVRSQGDQRAVLRGGFKTGIYSYDGHDSATVVLLDGPADNPSQAVTIRLFWQPRAGRTPIDQTATNATIHYVIFAGDESRQAGVYSGAGFVYPRNYPGGSTFDAGVWEANLLLTDRSENFRDLLGQARLEGSFNARRDDADTAETIRKLNVLVRDRLGYPRLVKAE